MKQNRYERMKGIAKLGALKSGNLQHWQSSHNGAGVRHKPLVRVFCMCKIDMNVSTLINQRQSSIEVAL